MKIRLRSPFFLYLSLSLSWIALDTHTNTISVYTRYSMPLDFGIYLFSQKLETLKVFEIVDKISMNEILVIIIDLERILSFVFYSLRQMNHKLYYSRAVELQTKQWWDTKSDPNLIINSNSVYLIHSVITSIPCSQSHTYQIE